jgi:hypothetical protein
MATIKTPQNSRSTPTSTRPRAIGVLVDARPRVATGMEATMNSTAHKRWKPLFETFIRYSRVEADTGGEFIMRLGATAKAQLFLNSGPVRRFGLWIRAHRDWHSALVF